MNSNQYRPTPTATLILSPDPLAGALIGAAVELIGHRIEFVRPGESAREALRRVRPAMLLLDCDDPNAADEALLGPAMMMGARIFLFGDTARTQLLQPVAIRYRLGVIVFPRDVEHLAEILASVASPAQLQE